MPRSHFCSTSLPLNSAICLQKFVSSRRLQPVTIILVRKQCHYSPCCQRSFCSCYPTQLKLQQPARFGSQCNYSLNPSPENYFGIYFDHTVPEHLFQRKNDLVSQLPSLSFSQLNECLSRYVLQTKLLQVDCYVLCLNP